MPVKRESIAEGQVLKEGYLYKLGRKSNMWVKRYYVVKDNSLLIYEKKGDLNPKSKLFMPFFDRSLFIDVIFLYGMYIERAPMNKNLLGFSIAFESDLNPPKYFYVKEVMEL